MNQKVLYQWSSEIANRLDCLNSWQVANVSLFSLGILLAENCQQHPVARQVVQAERVDSCARRWRRFLDNQAFPLTDFFSQWTRWVTQAMKRKVIYLLVDETKLEDRLGAMVVGVACHNRCIPLAWRCYKANCTSGYPAEGQVKMIESLLKAVKVGLEAETKVIVLADRGIGCSSAMCKMVADLGWHYLFRVTCHSTIETASRKCVISAMVNPGEHWSSEGRVFPSRGRLEAKAHAI